MWSFKAGGLSRLGELTWFCRKWTGDIKKFLCFWYDLPGLVRLVPLQMILENRFQRPLGLSLVCDFNRTPSVMAKHRGSCVHFSGISTCGRTSPETVSHPQRQPLPTPYKISLPVYVIVTNKRLQPLTSTLYNYVNPIYCVATVCHQVRCMYWGHLGHFHRAISYLKWYKIVCMRCLACTFSQMKSINMFFMFSQSGVPKHFRWRFFAVWIYNLTVVMSMHVNIDLKL